MGITPWTIYWITRLDEIGLFCAIGLVIGTIAIITLLIIICTYYIDSDNRYRSVQRHMRHCCAKMKKICLKISFVCIILICILTFLPSTKQAVAIYIIPKIANNEHINNIGENLLGIADEKTRQYLEGLLSMKKQEPSHD